LKGHSESHEKFKKLISSIEKEYQVIQDIESEIKSFKVRLIWKVAVLI
jgi:hypothetical protein